ncbi:MAG: hypothetical protein IJ012_02560 [Clostridia bacterium]|nr:hypothetical protein [Clostridia bacterium]
MLLKGSQKKIVRLQSAGSRLFDEAFFVLRDDAAPPATGDMLTEANRILEESMLPRRAARGKHAFLSFLVYTACFLAGGGIASLFWAIFLLL